MATESQINANRQNAQHSTGPVTAEGKSTSSKNALTLGLYTRQDYVKPEEREIYKHFCQTMYQELAPVTLLEQSLAAEITGASWRLRRCSAVEAELADYQTQDPMLDANNEKTIRSIERARASAHSLLHRSVNQLRRLQTDRLSAATFLSPVPVPADLGIADYKKLAAAAQAKQKAAAVAQSASPQSASQQAEDDFMAEFEAFCAPPPPLPNESASFCKSPQSPAQGPAEIPRNAACPCGSRNKYKRCCGRNAPPVLNRAA